ncbi:hypothetical protein RRG08_067234 [Elysia crispata]|uniref:Uncharacterized protein n=1 Tax=Elysia crispata TaxID=231223 RepID=A0AAE1ABU6_9GAST|nr:hypothetical protein RRG08_067234 [Elysia crispata]
MESHQQLSSSSFYPTPSSCVVCLQSLWNLINSYHLHSTPLRPPAWFVFNPNGISSAVLIFILPHSVLLRVIIFTILPHSVLLRGLSSILMESHQQLSSSSFYPTPSSCVVCLQSQWNLINSYHLHHSTPLLSPVWFVFNPNGISSAVIIFTILPHFFLLCGLSSILMESHQQLSSLSFYPTPSSCVVCLQS